MTLFAIALLAGSRDFLGVSVSLRFFLVEGVVVGDLEAALGTVTLLLLANTGERERGKEEGGEQRDECV